jgi:hypothetical protein
MDVVAPSQGTVLNKAAGLCLKIWSGADPASMPAASAPQEARRPGPVLHRLPDLRKFGPNFV